MSNKVNWVITDHHITVSYDGKREIVKREDPLADRVIKALKEGRNHEIPALVEAAKRIETFSQGTFTVKDGRVLVRGVPAPKVLGDKIIRFSKEGLPYQPLVKFAENLQANPSFRAVNELYSFLEKNEHAITEEGKFIAYKRVRSDFKDIHSGTFDNTPGNVLEMPRNQVNEDPNQTCSNGLHVANWDYAHTKFASNDAATDVMLEVEVNPADVVSVPVDYNNSKMRVCRYKVLNVVTTPYTGPSLRRTETQATVTRETDGFSSANNEDEEKGATCNGCGVNAVYDGVCDECGHEAVYDCENCNDPGCAGCCADCGYEDCEGDCQKDHCEYCGDADCYGDCEDEEEDEDEDEDRYPFEDELD